MRKLAKYRPKKKKSLLVFLPLTRVPSGLLLVVIAIPAPILQGWPMTPNLAVCRFARGAVCLYTVVGRRCRDGTRPALGLLTTQTGAPRRYSWFL